MHEKLVNRLNEFIQLEHDIRSATSEDALGFVVVNYLRKLVRYESAVWLHASTAGRAKNEFRVATVSGVSDFENSAPLVQLSQNFCNTPALTLRDTEIHRTDTLPSALAGDLQQLELSQIVSVAVIPGQSVLLLFRENVWQLHELQLLQQVAEVVSHSQKALANSAIKTSRFSRSSWKQPGWRWVACALCLLALIPVRQNVIANGEIAAVAPAVVSSGLAGVVEEVLVRPNQNVQAGDLLVRFDADELTLQQASIEKELRLATEKLRKAQQLSLNDSDEVNTISDLKAKMDLRHLELDYINEKLSRLEVRAPSDGVVLFSRKKDWEGRAVQSGEKIMEVASHNDRKFEIWVDPADAIELERGGDVRFFPDADPLKSLNGQVEQVSYFSSHSGGVELGFRVIAHSEENEKPLRLGTKGTFRLYGKRVLLGYQLLRKPLSVVRRTVGV